MAYGSALQSLLGGAGGGAGAPPSPMGAPPAPPSLGMGAPPQMPGMPPPPTGIGAMPTGDPSTSKKASADQAILALRECKGHYPSLAPMIDGTIDALKGAASPKPGEKPPALGTPQPPGAAGLDASPVTDSGAPGAM